MAGLFRRPFVFRVTERLERFGLDAGDTISLTVLANNEHQCRPRAMLDLRLYDEIEISLSVRGARDPRVVFPSEIGLHADLDRGFGPDDGVAGFYPRERAESLLVALIQAFGMPETGRIDARGMPDDW